MEVWSRTSITTGSQAFFSAAALRSKRASWSGVSRLVPSAANLSIIHVQMMFGDVALDGRREVADRFAARDRAAQYAARDVGSRPRAKHRFRRIEAGCGELRRVGRFAAIADRTGHHHDRREPADLLRLAPTREQARCIPAQHKEKLVARALAAELAQGVGGVGRAAPADLDVGDLETTLRIDGQPAHLQALGT